MFFSRASESSSSLDPRFIKLGQFDADSRLFVIASEYQDMHNRFDDSRFPLKSKLHRTMRTFSTCDYLI